MMTFNRPRTQRRTRGGTHLLFGLGFDVESSDPDGTPVSRTPHAASTPSSSDATANNEPNDQHHYYSILSLPQQYYDDLHDSQGKELNDTYTMFGNDPFDFYTGGADASVHTDSPSNLYTTQPTIMVDHTQEHTADTATPSGLARYGDEEPTEFSDQHSTASLGSAWALNAAATAEDATATLHQWPSMQAQDAAPTTLSVAGASPSPIGFRPLGRANSFTSIASATSSTGLSGVFDANLEIDDKRSSGSALRPGSSASASDSISDLHSSPSSYADELPHVGPSTAASPSSKATSASASSSSVGPHRKVRYKCTPEQVEQLHAFFAANRNPTGKVRRELAMRIGMPERSVQIWFQNRRAKIKHRGDSGSNASRSSSLRRIGSVPKMSKSTSASASTLTPEAAAAAASNAPGSSSASASSASPAPRLPNARKSAKAKNALSSFESVIQIPTFSICIGTWRRVRPLTCFFSRNHRLFGWTMRSDSVGFKMECPYSSVREVTFNGPIDPSMSELAEQICEPLGLLCIRLHRPPMFNMQTFKSASKPGEAEPIGTTWRQCEDFTEGRQGTESLTHILSGPFGALRDVVLKLRDSDVDLARRLYMNDEVTHHFASQSGNSSVNINTGIQTAPGDMHRQFTNSFSEGQLTRNYTNDTWSTMSYATNHGGGGESLESDEDAGGLHSQLRLDQSFFDQHHHDGSVGGGYEPHRPNFRPMGHLAVMGPGGFQQQQHSASPSDQSHSSMQQQQQHMLLQQQLPRASMQSHHSAPSSYEIIDGSGGNPGGAMHDHNQAGHYDVLQGLGLTGMDPSTGAPQPTTTLLSAPSSWGNGPSHLSAPAAPQSAMLNQAWSPLIEQQGGSGLAPASPHARHQHEVAAATTGYMGTTPTAATTTGHEEYPFFH